MCGLYIGNYGNILIDDITDHLPVFCMLPSFEMTKSDVPNVIFRRYLTERNLEELKNKLESENWEKVLNCENVNDANNLFLSMFRKLFDTCCPKKRLYRKNMIKNLG